MDQKSRVDQKKINKIIYKSQFLVPQHEKRYLNEEVPLWWSGKQKLGWQELYLTVLHSR